MLLLLIRLPLNIPELIAVLILESDAVQRNAQVKLSEYLMDQSIGTAWNAVIQQVG